MYSKAITAREPTGMDLRIFSVGFSERYRRAAIRYVILKARNERELFRTLETTRRRDNRDEIIISRGFCRFHDGLSPRNDNCWLSATIRSNNYSDLRSDGVIIERDRRGSYARATHSPCCCSRAARCKVTAPCATAKTVDFVTPLASVFPFLLCLSLFLSFSLLVILSLSFNSVRLAFLSSLELLRFSTR